MSPLSDEKIIELYFERNQAAISETSAKYGAYCGAVAYNIVRDASEAEECVNDALFSAWRSIPPEKPVMLRAFLAKITRNFAINRYNAERAQKRGGGEAEACVEELSDMLSLGSGPEEEIAGKELSGLIDKFLKSLPTLDASIMIRRYFYTEAVKDIAKKYGLTPGNVSVSLNRNRAKLKKFLEKEGYRV